MLLTLNKVYYKISTFLERSVLENERVLTTLIVTKESPAFFRSKSRLTAGFLVITTHRAFLITASHLSIAAIDKLLYQHSILVLETIDFSSPVNLIETYDPRNIFDRRVAKRFVIRPDGSDESETWHVLPNEGNNYRLLEAILEKRNRIE